MKRNGQKRRAAFTLIELMVVLVVIGILIAGLFRLLGMVGESNRKAVTITQLQRLQNALSGFYAEYGTYPPVTRHGDQNAPGCQPIGFEYPSPISMNKYINLTFEKDRIRNVNEVLGPTAATQPEYEWQKIKIFKFGVLSYLLPRMEVVGVPPGNNAPDSRFFDSQQWVKNNTGSLAAQRERENRAALRWLPALENSLWGGHNILGVETGSGGGINFTGAYSTTPSTGKIVDPGTVSSGDGTEDLPADATGKYVLIGMTMRDGWGYELYYYSAPPYQSYRVWSAGPNGATFPPWIALDSPNIDRKTVSAWVEDDIVRFDR